MLILIETVGSRQTQHLQRQRWDPKPVHCYQLSSFDSNIKAIEKRESTTFMDYISVSSI